MSSRTTQAGEVAGRSARQSNPGRRRFVRTLGAAGLAAGIGPYIITRRAGAAARTLRILQWSHFVPAYDEWFDNTYTRDWGRKNDTEVIVDHVGITALNSRAAAEVSAQQGHDLFMFLWPPPSYEEQVIDHKEIYDEVARKHGKPADLALRSTFNPKTKKYFAFSDSFVPDPVNFRIDLWSEQGMPNGPKNWDDVRRVGRAIKDKRRIPVGVGLSSELDTGMAMRTILYAFGGEVQNEHGQVTLKSKPTVEAVKFVRALYQEAMTPQVMAWDASSNNRAMLAGQASLILNAISVTREAEDKKLPIADQIGLTKALMGEKRAIGLEHVMDCYVIWKFAQNQQGAKKFLVDYIDNFHAGFEASKYYNFPCFANTVPDLRQLLEADPHRPAGKYKVLDDVLQWATNVGYPGYANAAIDEVFGTWVINTMFAKAASGVLSPEDAVAEADSRVHRIFAKWQERHLV